MPERKTREAARCFNHTSFCVTQPWKGSKKVLSTLAARSIHRFTPGNKFYSPGRNTASTLGTNSFHFQILNPSLSPSLNHINSLWRATLISTFLSIWIIGGSIKVSMPYVGQHSFLLNVVTNRRLARSCVNALCRATLISTLFHSKRGKQSRRKSVNALCRATLISINRRVFLFRKEVSVSMPYGGLHLFLPRRGWALS